MDSNKYIQKIRSPDEVRAYREFLQKLQDRIPGATIIWIGSNSDGLDRQWKGVVRKLQMTDGVMCTIQATNVVLFGPLNGHMHSSTVLACFNPIDMIDLAQVSEISIPQLRASVFFKPQPGGSQDERRT